jgi:hypothetical protein
MIVHQSLVQYQPQLMLRHLLQLRHLSRKFQIKKKKYYLDFDLFHRLCLKKKELNYN